ncbi:MAG TPA: hypothetical protein PKI10_10120, partial [Syntrophorhabdus sp.]|nr:hypothetical protein [Syntrophorhabdus sp.]
QSRVCNLDTVHEETKYSSSSHTNLKKICYFKRFSYTFLTNLRYSFLSHLTGIIKSNSCASIQLTIPEPSGDCVCPVEEGRGGTAVPP